jgi:hypothetical protein
MMRLTVEGGRAINRWGLKLGCHLLLGVVSCQARNPHPFAHGFREVFC